MEEININSSDYGHILELIQKHGKDGYVFTGKDQDGCKVIGAICKHYISIDTWQDNGWIRTNTYWDDFTTEETFKGRWKRG